MALEKSILAKDDENLEKNNNKSELHNQKIHHHHCQRGGIKTAPFILANEVCVRFATIGFNSNLVSYLTQQLYMSSVTAANTLTNLEGASHLTPLLAAFFAESFAGTFWIIIAASVIYQLGLISITISASLPSLHPPPCPTKINCHEATPLQLWSLYLSLLLVALGSGGIKPCVMPFLADQFDMSKKGVASRKWNIFNLYTFSMGLAPLIALTSVVYVQDNMGWSWGLGIPTIAMLVSIIAFVLGSPLYNKVKPHGCPTVRLVQVIVAAIKKRKENLPHDSRFLYENEDLDAAISLQGRLLHTHQFKWLDKAAIVTKEDYSKDPNSPPNLWRLSTVHRVEELKSIIRMLPIITSSILLITASSSSQYFLIQQARSMNRHLTPSFQIPPASMFVFGVLTMMISVVLYERLLVPLARRFTGNSSGLTCIQRMGIGFGISIVSTTVAALMEIKRKKVAEKFNLLDDPAATIPMSVFWLVPTICLTGLAKSFGSSGHIEFLYDQSPESMRSSVIAISSLFNSIGYYGGTLLLSFVHKYSGNNEKNWLPDRNINKGRLEYYYFLVSGVQVLNLVYYLICAWFYTSKPLEEIGGVMNIEDDLEKGKEKILLVESVEDQKLMLAVKKIDG